MTALISFFFQPKVTKKYWFTRSIPVFRFLPQPIEISKSLRKDGAGSDMQNEELGFLFASPRTRNGRIVKTTNKALLWRKTFSLFSVKREMPILFFVNCERTVLFSVKRDLDPPPPLYHPHTNAMLLLDSVISVGVFSLTWFFFLFFLEICM